MIVSGVRIALSLKGGRCPFGALSLVALAGVRIFAHFHVVVVDGEHVFASLSSATGNLADRQLGLCGEGSPPHSDRRVLTYGGLVFAWQFE